ncbi:MAG TPA: alginate export family protein [Verrucomicrobiae bacterium]
MRTATQLLCVMLMGTPLMIARGQSASTAAKPAAPPPELSPTEQTIKDIKNPFPWLSWGADLRVRDEHFESLLTLNPNDAANLHEQDYVRFRARLWASVTPFEDLSLNARLSDEVREWLKPAGYTPYRTRSGLDWRDGILDNLNVQWRNVLQQPAVLTVGRQDIFLGDGWLVGDGTPGDGSWTYFLDSARLTYDLKEQHTTLDFIGIIQDAHDNGWLPTINDNQYLTLTEQNEKGAILWVANKSIKEANIDGYFMYKHDDLVTDISRSDNADIYTLGGRITGLVCDHWKYSAEGAYQFGEKQDTAFPTAASRLEYHDINAYGVNTKVTYLVKDRLNNQISLSYEFLSGDDPNTKNDEMFDNLWGRWPRWSEIGLYSYASETRVGNEANLHRVGPTWSIDPIKNMNFSASYYALFAEHDVATRGAAGAFTGTGNFRGHFASAVLKYKFSKHVNAHLWSEFEFPGDYYSNRQTWYFLRPEIMITF